jgi:O-glycosyl hydrolase
MGLFPAGGRVSQPIRIAEIQIDLSKRFQAIDGWGVNINSKYWDGGNLVPVMEMLIDDLGCTLFRQDAYGKSNWVDPRDEYDASILNPGTYKKVYAGRDFQNAAGMARYLNGRGIQPYICLSGITPKWMNAKDGRTLKDYKSFAEMACSYASWLKKNEKIKFQFFGPINETDIGPPEGPYVGPDEYWKVAEVMVDAFDRWGLKDLKLVVPEIASPTYDYFPPIVKSRKLVGRIGVFGLHNYGDHFDIAKHQALVAKSPFKDCRWWMTEYGDLDQSGEKEWYVAFASYRRLLRMMGQGFHGAINWDAYDNYHDHDESWSIYGLIRWGIRDRTPKKRYYAARQMYRFVRPGWVRVEAVSDDPGLKVRAFLSPDGKQLTVTGLNEAGPRWLNFRVNGMKDGQLGRQATAYRTTPEDNCVPFKSFKTSWHEWESPELTIPDQGIFTVTTLSK